MKKYRANAASPVRTDYGTELVIGLRFFPETASAADPMEQVNDELYAQYTARIGLRRSLIVTRVAMRFAQYQVDQLIRMMHRAAEIADGGRRGAISVSIFPDGLTPVIAPSGRRQIKPTEDLLDRLEKSKVPGIDGFRAEWRPKLKATLDDFKAKADAYKGAHDKYIDAFKEELSLREEHYRMVDKIIGLVRAAFPGDRQRQDLVFPEVAGDGESLDDEGESTDEKKAE